MMSETNTRMNNVDDSEENVVGGVSVGNESESRVFVERMFKKSMWVIGKGDLARMVYVQYRAIGTLVSELSRVDPGNALIKVRDVTGNVEK